GGVARSTGRGASSRAPPGRHSPRAKRSKARTASPRAPGDTAPRREDLSSASMSDAATPAIPRERTVADVMSTPVVTALPAETVAVAAQRMSDGKVGSVVVIDHDDRAIGILTERDMIRLAAAGSDASTAKVSEWMT